MSGLLTLCATTGGLFSVFPWAASAVVAGIAVGLIAPTPGTSGLIGALVGLAGAIVGPETTLHALYDVGGLLDSGVVRPLLSAAICAAVALLVTLICRWRSRAVVGFLALALVVIVGNLWLTAFRVNAIPMVYNDSISFNEQVQGNFPGASDHSDSANYYRVYAAVRAGGDFYREYARRFTPEFGRPPTSIVDFRVPLIFWVWSALPNPSWIVIAFLLLASAAVISVVPIGLATVKLPLVLPGAAALASYFYYFTGNIELFRQEPWAAALGVVALGALAASLRSPRWRAWTCGAVVFAVLAVLTRETMAFLLLAGFASAFFGDRSRRRFRLEAWGGGLVAFAGIYGLHYMAARPYIVSVAELPRAGQGGVGFMLAAFAYATDYLGYNGWLPTTLAAMGFVGALVVRDRGLRVLVLVATLAPLASFLVLGNNAHDVYAGATEYVNYWGTAVVPLLYAFAPAAFAIFPGAEARGELA